MLLTDDSLSSLPIKIISRIKGMMPWPVRLTWLGVSQIQVRAHALVEGMQKTADQCFTFTPMFLALLLPLSLKSILKPLK